MVGQATPKLVLPEVLAEGKVLIVSLASGLLGDEAAALLGALVVAELWHATTARAGLPASGRTPVMAYLDEWSRFLHLPTPMAAVLAEARGLGLGMVVAHQHLAQLPADARDAVLSNARSRVVFQLPDSDARIVGRALGGVFTADDLTGLGAYEVVAQLFASGTTQPPASARTRPMPPTLVDPEAVRRHSRERYGVAREEVDAAIRRRPTRPNGRSNAAPTAAWRHVMSRPFGSPVGSSSEKRSTCSANQSGQISPTTDIAKTIHSGKPATSRRPHLTSARLAKLQSELSTRDRAILADVARLKVMSGQQLRRLHYADSANGRRLARLDLKRLSDKQLLARLGRRVGGERAGSEGFIYSLDTAGQRLLLPHERRYRRPWTPGNQFLTHALAVAELSVELRLRSNSCRLESFDAEPDCWRSFYGPGGHRAWLKPDAYVVTIAAQFEDHWFIELDLSTESGPRLATKMRSYLRYWQSGREQVHLGLFPRVVWIVPDRPRLDFVEGVIAEQPAEAQPLFAVLMAQTAAHQLLEGLSAEPAP